MRQREGQRAALQTDLFQPPTDRPKWSMLPPDVQVTARKLLARLLREARFHATTDATKETSHEQQD